MVNTKELKVGDSVHYMPEHFKESWSREEVERLITDSWIAGGKDAINRTYYGPEDWIKENL